ncbi:hypothetical protein PICSAR240_02926 [Mycobacterium avium subsp. paratuberculosis]|uniref:Thioesterase domain-containing protein n=1 Tax=Mycolicibacterium paratuberculosis (strain ATCC BAA-968 / K-10) TaxID=262316 RepID=Q73Z56_MYCPA|nr:hypothetical protein [Mycobacterium avium]ETB01628.1 hypothetical protein O979_13265 [Mycobacterium avium subsp. paratuberculosis 10-4404]ETB03969.1 hypothetical protein O978_11425 [Mycobacterium avium subsp. paratuberculosis 10-5864]ETB51635.1 hypothetical protein O976_11575 [Mycobacterium avium subsp. paratuberculosis 10-8425]AAS04064.1 hypothetical protein MAP_1747c [Mycobacterium avium subsp. paratuberculosis K-10]AGL36991.1 hypothetical protein MAP4_2083 [Mycobacterium avium subsp. par
MSDRLRDIRELAGHTDTYRDELYRRWTGLLSYRYIGRKHSSMNLGETDDTVTIRRDMRNEAGGIMVAPLAISSPEGCQTDMVAVPNPVIASVQIIDPGYDVKRVEIVGSGIVHQGRTMGYGRCTIVDADNPGRVIAFNEGQGAIIGVPPEGLDRMDVSGTELVIEDSDELPPLWRAFGASRRADGHWTLPELNTELASPDAALHIGPQHVVLETAAIDLAAEVAGTRKLQVVSWHVMFMSRGKVGPFRVEGTAHPGASGRVGVRMLLHDEGNADKAVTSAAAIFEVVG